MRYHSRADQGKGSHIEILAADSNVDCNDANASLLMRTLLTTPCKLARQLGKLLPEAACSL